MKSKIDFHMHEYPASHWSIDFAKAGTSIATITVRNKYHFSVILNPTDCQGYRSIIRYINEDKSSISSAFNRIYTLSEQRALNDVAAIMTKIYEKLGVIAQFSQLGNNSHHFNSQSRVIHVGDDEEPSLLHLHMWGRGDPEVEYIPGVPLRGPKPGLMFDLRTKVTPDKSELDTCITTFKNLLGDYIKSSEFIDEFENSIMVSFEETNVKGAQVREKRSDAGFFSSTISPKTCSTDSVSPSSGQPTPKL
ncbi:hypothetical protein [Legionella longbeachae]|uniref:hypothetical protein n=1 Tax=Legionella longbeachae TaxID=450 RepID=UPI0012468C0E|nr:hypothetical protein [Legionella longbeachae]QEY52710.1 hypothetical protein FQU71_16595 [Legionella longbeachae]